MTKYDIRSARRLAELQKEFRDGTRLLRRGEVSLFGAVFGRVLEPDGETIAEDWFRFPNAATTLGVNYLLEAGFRGGTAVSTWYAGLINNSGFTGVASTDTMSSHSGWSEFTGYAETTRRQWSPAAASLGSIVNTTAMSFTNGGSTANVIGCFINSDNTKSGSTGTLWATATEASARSIAASQVFQVFYEVDLLPQS